MPLRRNRRRPCLIRGFAGRLDLGAPAFSTQLLLEWKNGTTITPNVNLSANPDLAGMDNLEVFDRFLALAQRYGLKVMLDVHSAEADNAGHIYPVWFKGSITTDRFYEAWEWVTTWWGGNLRGVRDHPVDLGAQQDQLVYSPHDYGPSVFQQPWFNGNWDKATLTRDAWDPNWLFIHRQRIAPVLIGEWGGFMDGGATQRWMTALRDLIVEHRLHHTFWAVNPNSGDTGGLLTDDWATWDEAKYGLLRPSLWQHQGRFVSLDHEVPLGNATVGTTVTAVYR